MSHLSHPANQAARSDAFVIPNVGKRLDFCGDFVRAGIAGIMHLFEAGV